jgi:hypothetical protein
MAIYTDDNLTTEQRYQLEREKLAQPGWTLGDNVENDTRQEETSQRNEKGGAGGNDVEEVDLSDMNAILEARYAEERGGYPKTRGRPPRQGKGKTTKGKGTGKEKGDTAEDYPPGRFRRLVWSQDGPGGPAPTTDRGVLTALLEMGDYRTGKNIYPSQARLLEMTGTSKNTLKRSLQRLERDGWIIRERYRRQDGTYGVKVTYHLCMDLETRDRWRDAAEARDGEKV